MPGFGSVGVWEVILILAVLLLVFGAKRLPEIGAALGKGIREFKGSVREIENEINRPQNRADLPRQDAPPAQAPPQQAQGQQPAQSQPAGQGQESAQSQDSEQAAEREVESTRPQPEP